MQAQRLPGTGQAHSTWIIKVRSAKPEPHPTSLFMLLLAYLPFIPFVLSLATEHPSFIVGGSVVTANELPFAAHLLVDNHPKCGAAILSAGWVVTAAHCLTRNNALINRPLTVKVGDGDGDGKAYRASKLICHPDYEAGTFKNDIALIRLEKEISFDRGSQRIPISVSDIKANETLRAAGWGQTEAESSSKQLREVEVQTTSLAVCKLYIADFQDYSGPQICTGLTPGKDTCPGDSGGPLFRSENGVLKLVGLTSYGTYNPNDERKCGGADTVGVYTHIAHHMAYIEGVTGLSRRELTSERNQQKVGYLVSAGLKYSARNSVVVLAAMLATLLSTSTRA
ncbi:trypsin-like serine protease [Basidiobolus meristosporus CBS 931.73]|uniref:Trypsin-like serine protease n=1 Tax=Basidiobolus meristosporus CBS 931.73 TaxID=1314790 RepID=A0A1Y1XS71_9FUNG|nr:trypsin-like serine protease [Basidiobolus meristosporus CBS 931.73]|eukprot:ORX88573.1 trypsin-like serine protease [Basidiobolus meristosporus CBS 931.73]